MFKQKQIFTTAWLLGVSLFPLAAKAAGPNADSADVYSFGGACPSQGAYTQAALKETRRISDIATALMNNPDCGGLTGVIQNLKNAEEALGGKEGETRGGASESLPSEIDALRRMVVAGNTGETITNLLFKKTMAAAAEGSKAADVSIGADAAALADPSSAVRAIYNRSKRATRYGLTQIQAVFKQLPSLDKCLMGRPDQEMLLVSSAIKMGAAFASSGGGVGHELGSALAGLVEMMQKRKFTRVIGEAKERELWTSISCILETSAKNFCDGENAQELLKWSRENYYRSMKKVMAGAGDPQNDNPLEGYYLLMRDLPLISQWLNKVKFGVDPKNESDAANQIDAMEVVIEFQKIMKKVPGMLEQGIRDMMAIPSERSRQLALLDLIELIERNIRGGRGGKFVLQAKVEELIPYYLVGLDGIPDEVVKSNPRIPWIIWMNSYGPNKSLQGFFDDPVALAQTLRIRSKDLLAQGEANAQAFFRNRLLIDPANLVSMTLTGQNNSVKEALFHTIRYLVRLEKRLDRNSESDMTILPNVVETRERLTKIVSAYDGFLRLSQEYLNGDLQTFSKNKEYDDRSGGTGVVQKLIDTAYDELEILYLSDAFLSARLATLIDYDFSRQIRRGLNMSKHQRDLLAISQEHMVERLIQLHGVDPSPTGDDLARAQDLNSENLLMLENLFRTPFLKALEELDQIVHGRDASSKGLRNAGRKRFEQDREREMAKYANDPFSQFVGWLRSGETVRKRDRELYERPNNPHHVWSASDDVSGSKAKVRALMCIQSLAFQNRGEFYEICKDAELTSHYSYEDMNQQLSVKYADFWPAPSRSRTKAWVEGTATRLDAIAWNESHIRQSPDKQYRARMNSQRICALNDRNIRNFVYLLQDRDRRESATKLEALLKQLPKPLVKSAPPPEPESSIPTETLDPFLVPKPVVVDHVRDSIPAPRAPIRPARPRPGT